MTQNMAKAAKWLKAGGYIGTALSGMDTALEIDKACSTGRESECTKAKIVDTTEFISSTALGALSVEWGAWLATGIALFFAPETGGLSLAILSILGAGGTAYTVGEIAPKVGGVAGNIIYSLAKTGKN